MDAAQNIFIKTSLNIQKRLKSNKKYNLNNIKSLQRSESSACYIQNWLISKNLQINIDFARMTGSGSVIIGYFRKKIDALWAKLIKKKYKNYCVLYLKLYKFFFCML